MTNRRERRKTKQVEPKQLQLKLGTFGEAVFCDEIRFETSGRISAMGVYHPTVVMQAFPSILRVSAFAKYHRKDLADHPIPVRLVYNGEVIMGPAVIQSGPDVPDMPVMSFNTVGGAFGLTEAGTLEWQVGYSHGKHLRWRTIGSLKVTGLNASKLN